MSSESMLHPLQRDILPIHEINAALWNCACSVCFVGRSDKHWIIHVRERRFRVWRKIVSWCSHLPVNYCDSYCNIYVLLFFFFFPALLQIICRSCSCVVPYHVDVLPNCESRKCNDQLWLDGLLSIANNINIFTIQTDDNMRSLLLNTCMMCLFVRSIGSTRV